MKTLIQTPLEEIRAKEQQLKMKDAQLQNLGLSLAQEKIKNAQKDTMLSALGQEIAALKIEVAQIKNVKGDA